MSPLRRRGIEIKNLLLATHVSLLTLRLGGVAGAAHKTHLLSVIKPVMLGGFENVRRVNFVSSSSVIIVCCVWPTCCAMRVTQDQHRARASVYFLRLEISCS